MFLDNVPAGHLKYLAWSSVVTLFVVCITIASVVNLFDSSLGARANLQYKRAMASCYTAALALSVALAIVYFKAMDTPMDTTAPMVALFVTMAAALVGTIGNWVVAEPSRAAEDSPKSQAILGIVELLFGAGALGAGIAAVLKH